jgi:hypothetical protein
MTEIFGGDESAWGEVAEIVVEDAEGGSDHLPSEIDLGGGMKLVLSPDAFRTIMHSAEITAKVAQRAAQICDTANSMAVVEGAEYIYTVSSNPDNIRARARVHPGNAKAIVDNDTHATLIKSLASVGSDPLPENYGTWEGTTTPPDDEAPT